MTQALGSRRVSATFAGAARDDTSLIDRARAALIADGFVTRPGGLVGASWFAAQSDRLRAR